MSEPHALPESSVIDFIRQGRVKTTVSACCDQDSLWVEVRRHYSKPWQMTPALARGLADLLREAADKAEAMVCERTEIRRNAPAVLPGNPGNADE